MTIDWSRLVRPQPDGYDSEVALSFRAERPTPSGEPPSQIAVRPVGALAGGDVMVGLSALPLLPAPRFAPVEEIAPNLLRALAYVDLWPEAAVQWRRMVQLIECFTDVTIPETERATYLGSASHSVDRRPGHIGLTVDCALATAQAVVHEAAHNKLRALGVGNETAIRIVINPQDELFPSPVVLDRLRPMTAVLHAQYSFVHVLQLNLKMFEAESDVATRTAIRKLIDRNAVRMQAGRDTIAKHARLDREGEAFVGGLVDWTDQLLSQAERISSSDARGVSHH